MRLEQVLFTQGFGTRRDCHALALSGRVCVKGIRLLDPNIDLPVDGLVFEIDGVAWPFHTQAIVLMHKPLGHECSMKPRHHPSVMALLPQPLRTRGLQPVGRLDVDTTGILMLTDDGALLHQLTSPKHHVAKVYQVTTRHAIAPIHVEQLLAGVVLDDDPEPVRALSCRATAERSIEITIEQGRYHQVKRMVAAVGNRVEALHRSRFGPWILPADLPLGQWLWVTPTDPVARASGTSR